jgi:CHAD domain-containing protein
MAANTTQTQSRRDAPQTTPTRRDPRQTAPARDPRQAALTRRNARQAVPRPEPRQVPIAGIQPRRSASAGEVVLAYLKIHAGTLSSLEPKVRADEPDSVHQMRVATRRLRAALRSFGEVIPRSRSAKAAAELKWLGGMLSPVRDGEVLPKHLQASLRSVPVELLIGPVQARVQGHFSPRRAAAYTELIEALDSPRYAALLSELDRLTTEPPLGPQAGDPAREVFPAAVRRAYRQAKKRMSRARHTPSGPARDTALHEARKSARRARYAAEAARPATGKPARRFSRQMKKVQSVLGDHQDSVIARQAARDLGIGAHLAGENAFSYGLLYELQSHQAGQLQTDARHVWKKASRSCHRRWMP